MKRIAVVTGLILLLFLGFVGYQRANRGHEAASAKPVPKRTKIVSSASVESADTPQKADDDAQASATKTVKAEVLEETAASAGPMKSEAAKEMLVTSLKRFATLKAYSFQLDYRLTSNGQELLQLSSLGRVRDHQYTHATTSYSGNQSEVVSNGAQSMVRNVGATDEDWQTVDGEEGGMEEAGNANPAQFLEAMNAEVMKYVQIDQEGEATVDGRKALVLSLPWNQALADGESDEEVPPMQSTGRVKFYVDAKTQQILQWQMESDLRQSDDPTQNVQLALTTKLSGFDEGWDVPLPDTVKEYLAWK